MQHLASPEQPAFLVDTEREAYELDWLGREIIGNPALSQELKLYRTAVVNGELKDNSRYFWDDSARLILGGLVQVVNTLPKNSQHRIVARDMLNDYEASLAEATAANAPHLVAAA